MSSPPSQGRNRLPSLTPKLKGSNWVIQFSYKSTQKYLSFGTGKTGKTAATATANRILGDLQTGNFDPSLDKYRSTPKLIPKQDENDSHSISTLDLWDRWVESLSLSGRTKNGHYAYCRKWIEKYASTIADAGWLVEIECSASTWNDRRRMIQSCFDWGIENKLISINPYKQLKNRKESRNREKRKPFNSDEVEKILNGFSQSVHYSHYYDFVVFILTVGCRPSEAIGLTWDCIDWQRNELTIKQSGSRNEDGKSNGKARVIKERKTGNQTVFTIPESLALMLLERSQNKQHIDLVFPSPKGRMIDDRSFCNRAWKSVLTQAGVEYRPPYTARHTMASRLIEQGVPLTGVAYLLGHTDTSMVSKHYGHMINRPQLPDL